MEDVAALCPRIIVIDHGHIVYDGSLAELVRSTRPEKRVRLTFAADVDAAALELAGARVVERSGREAQLSVPQADLQSVVSRLLAQLPVLDLTVEDPPLEEVLGDLFARSEA
jgi:ABC-2 type transport system ATP-binding protein